MHWHSLDMFRDKFYSELAINGSVVPVWSLKDTTEKCDYLLAQKGVSADNTTSAPLMTVNECAKCCVCNRDNSIAERSCFNGGPFLKFSKVVFLFIEITLKDLSPTHLQSHPNG